MAKSRKIVISFPEQAYALYMRFLKESLLTPSAFFIAMLAEKARGEKEKDERRPVGRPKTKESEDERMLRIQAEPKDVKHPAFDEAFGGHKNEMCTLREAEAWCAWMDADENKRAWAQALPYYIPKEERVMND